MKPARSHLAKVEVVPRLIILFLAAVVCTSAAPLKFRVSNPPGNGPLAVPGAKLLADYGSFQLVEADETVAASLLAAGAEPAVGSDRIELNTGPLDIRRPEVGALRKRAGDFAGRKLHLVQFVGPVKPEWCEALEQAGVQVVHYVPQNTYLVRGNAPALARLQTWAATAEFVQWEGAFADDYKFHPLARVKDAQGRALAPATGQFTIQLVEDAETNPATLALIDRLKLEPVRHRFRALHYLNLTTRLPAGHLAEIAARSDVISIHPYFPKQKLDERQAQILAGNLSGNVPSGPGYLAWLAGRGFTQAQFTASGLLVDVSDSGVDNGTLLPGHFGLYQNGDQLAGSRVAYARLEGIPNLGSTLEGCDGHGNLNTHIIAGHDDLSGFPFADASGYHYGLGTCPFVKVGASVIFDPEIFTFPDYADLQSRAYHDGARISCNSWGGTGNGVYDSDSQCYDALVRDAQPAGSAFAAAGNQPMTLVFAAGNDGPVTTTVCSPGTGKNVITVGAGEGVQSFGGTDGSGVSDTGANSANDLIGFSGRGPCTDGRKKPDLIAPGTHISGGVAQVDNPAFAGTAIACFNGSGVSGGASGASFFPSSQEFYTASSGTSHSTPAIAGCCALVRQYFLNQSLAAPSPAMTKAYLMNSTRHMTGFGANDTLPSNNQGMGAANLGMAFDGTARVLRDQLAQDKFVASGETRIFTGTVSDTGKPFRVTLAWTDAPGSTVGNAYNNDLDLAVTVGGVTYKGNVFSGAASVSGGTADTKNNVENVFLPAGVSGPYTVTVTAANINSDGVPNEAPALDQDLALVIYNAAASPSPGVVADGWTLAAESCHPVNGLVDAGEGVIVKFALRNAGSVNVSNVVATLQAAGGVTSPSGPQAYGLLASGGGAVTQAFTFTAQGSCGGLVNAALSLTNNGTNLGTAVFQIPLGGWQTFFTQNFDTASAPVLPSGWTTGNSGAQDNWTTTNASADSPPNVAISGESESAGVNDLTSPVISLPAGVTRLSFRNRVHLECDGLRAYDGGVLEIKIGTGSWTDILAAGGSFVLNGYRHASTNTSDNPLAGRQMWSGNSAGFLPTIVQLPSAAAGQNIQLRWRCGTDSGTGGGHWQVDTINLSSQVCCSYVDSSTPGIIARWDFNSLVNDATVATGVSTPSIGLGTAALYGGTSAGFDAGSSGDTNLTDNSGWNTATYPAQGAGNKTKGVRFTASTAGRQNIAVSFDERVSPNASKYVRLQYTVNGTTFVDFPVANAMSTTNVFETKSNSLAAIAGVNNNTNFAFRLVSEFESTAAGTANANYVTAGGNTYGTSGTIRYDLVTVWGTPNPVPLPSIMASATRYGPASGQVQFNLTGTTGYTWIVQASSNLLHWVPVATNTVPFTFSETNELNAPQRFYRARLWP